MARIPITRKGYDRLRQKLKDLKAMRPELARAIEVAREHGDLSENADYSAAKERSGMIEAQIRHIESVLANANVVDVEKITDFSKVVFGLSVRVLDLDSDEEFVYTIVGEQESDAGRGLISLESPLGRSLLGKSIGDVASVQLPSGIKEYEILEIFYKELQ